MAYDQGLAQRVRDLLEGHPGFEEKKMFGGIGYMLAGNMACGVNKDDLIVRVGPDRYEEALAQPVARVFDMTGRPMKGWVVVEPQGVEEDEDLEAWVQQGVDFTLTLPPK
jgi:TfoX/Sxy family transcriptional regulator of competence genes